jgi:hypothetical protein
MYFHTSLPSDVRSRPPSLILFSLGLNIMSEAKSVTISFEDEGPKTFSYEIDRAENAQLSSSAGDGDVTLYLSRAGCQKLAELLVKLGGSSYQPGFHLHIGKDFDPDAARVLCLTLSDE